MCFESLAWATKQELPAMQKIVLVMLADHNSKNGLCFPSYDTLAVECGMTKRSVITQVEKLEAANFLTIERFKNRANRYFLNVPASEPNSPQGESVSLQSEGRSPEPVIKPITKPKRTTTTTGVENLEIRGLTADEQECWDWAVMSTYWATACISIESFLKVYANQKGGLVSQFNAHKKARETWTASGLNSEKSFTNKTGGNYETRNAFNQPSRLSKHDQQSQRFNDARERAMAEWRASNHIIDIN